jgi:DNA-binding transcriptional MerR regulator
VAPGRGIAAATDTKPPGRSPPSQNEPLFLVGDLAKTTGKTVRAMHLYEELGLLQPHARSKGRYRLYGRDALLRVRWIHKMQDMGLSLAQITELVRGLETTHSAPVKMDRLRRVLEERLAQTREHIAKLRDLERELHSSLDYLDVCEHQCHPTRETSQCHHCELHESELPAPDLVAGVRTKPGDIPC